MCKKIIFLGAGASKDAGYPLTSQLYEELSREYKVTNLSNYKIAWKKVDKNFRLIKEMTSLSACNDIEYLMTVMHLLEDFHKQRCCNQLNQNDLNESIEHYSEQYSHEEAFRGFSECLNFYFGYKNYEMKDLQYNYLRAYLKENISDGDTIITTNYDLLAERILGDIGLWFIQDGYGFVVTLKETFKFYKNRKGNINLDEKTREKLESWIEDKDNAIKGYLKNKSKVNILKLHGSVGWLKNENNFVLDLTTLRYILPNYMHHYEDQNYKPELSDSNSDCLIFPTFMKNYKHPVLLDIWTKATGAIQEAKEIHFIGYSLPEYDTNIRTLLLPLRQKIGNKTCLAKIYVMNDGFKKDTSRRWKEFLGANIELVYIDSFEKYCEKF